MALITSLALLSGLRTPGLPLRDAPGTAIHTSEVTPGGARRRSVDVKLRNTAGGLLNGSFTDFKHSALSANKGAKSWPLLLGVLHSTAQSKPAALVARSGPWVYRFCANEERVDLKAVRFLVLTSIDQCCSSHSTKGRLKLTMDKWRNGGERAWLGADWLHWPRPQASFRNSCFARALRSAFWPQALQLCLPSLTSLHRA